MKGKIGMPFAVYLIIGLIMMLVLVPIALGFINSSGEAAQGCSTTAALISDMFEGGIQLC